ncbi:hypothetical protein [Ligilactobacillus acidipiscis]|nr:hypothetical protein [Ligilactobacillus acidipiscis]WEV57184.1 hypothetical protein OZX66_01175 [Ligilactobacillus acidipiscis]
MKKKDLNNILFVLGLFFVIGSSLFLNNGLLSFAITIAGIALVIYSVKE